MSWCPNLRLGLFWHKTWKIFSTEREKKSGHEYSCDKHGIQIYQTNVRKFTYLTTTASSGSLSASHTHCLSHNHSDSHTSTFKSFTIQITKSQLQIPKANHTKLLTFSLPSFLPSFPQTKEEKASKAKAKDHNLLSNHNIKL